MVKLARMSTFKFSTKRGEWGNRRLVSQSPQSLDQPLNQRAYWETTAIPTGVKQPGSGGYLKELIQITY